MAKNKEEVDMQSIKEYEKAMRSKIEPSEEQKIEFDQWWVIRSAELKQPIHVKEILRADAKARGLNKEEPISKWDWAARQFGLTL
jgi:hypothetical protein